MRLLTISSFFPPFAIGGAELCAQNLSRWFAGNGHEVAVLTAAPTPGNEAWGVPHENYKIYRVSTPHTYPVFDFASAHEWKKPMWHLQDLFDPRNEPAFERVIDEFRPDFIHIHWIQGLGYNGLKVIGRRDIPTAITLHDLAYGCVRTTMFRDGDECARQCATCRFSARVKWHYLKTIPRLGFISPSRSNLDRISELLPIARYPRFHILNPNLYPAPVVRHEPSRTARLMFAGRLEKTKGINLLLKVVEPLAERYDLTLTVLGQGPEEQGLRARYGHHPWLKITGQVPMQQVSDTMATSDMCLVPSLWLENSPGVVFQALGVALPVMGADKGGIPELIEPGVNGFLVPSGDEARWSQALIDVLEAPGQLAALRANAARLAGAFDYNLLAGKMLDAFGEIARSR